MADSIELLKDLDEVIKRKQQEIRDGKKAKAKPADPKPEYARTGKSVVRNEQRSTGKSVVRDEQRSTGKSLVCDQTKARADASRENGANSQGPITPEGKQRASANSLKHGFFANVEKLNPEDAPVYQRLVHDLRHTLHPDSPVEELHIRELAMLSARLQRLEAAEYALLCSEIEAPEPPTVKEDSKTPKQTSDQTGPVDSRLLAAAFLNTQDALAHFHKIEVHLRRAYNRTWDRLRIMQKERRRISPEESRKRTHQWLSEENERTSASSNHDPLADSRDFDDDFPPLPSSHLPPSGPPQEGGLPSPHGSPGSVTPKEPPSA